MCPGEGNTGEDTPKAPTYIEHEGRRVAVDPAMYAKFVEALEIKNQTKANREAVKTAIAELLAGHQADFATSYVEHGGRFTGVLTLKRDPVKAAVQAVRDANKEEFDRIYKRLGGK